MSRKTWVSRDRHRSTLQGAGAVLALLGVLFWATCASALSGQAAAADSVVRATLKNGLRVVVVPSRLAPVVTTMINYQVGSNQAPEGFPGTTHALEHMMFRGSPGLSAQQLAAIAAAMGGMMNADTQQTVTQYFFTVPSEELEVALRIDAIRMRGLLAGEALWDQERGAIEQEVAQDLSNPEYVFYTKLLAAMFKGTPYAHDALGTRPSFDLTTGAMLSQFHETWYVPNNAILVIVGDVDPQKAIAQVETIFNDISPKKIPERQDIYLEPVEPQTLSLTTDLPYGLAVIAFRLPGSDSPDYAAAQVLADVLASRRGSLYGLVPKGKALDVDFSMTSWPEAGLGYATAAFPDGSDGATLLKKVKKIIAKDVRKGFPADLVEAAKLHEVADAEFEKNSITGLAMAWSQALAVEGRQSPEEDVNAIKQVSVAEVNRVAKEYLDLKHAIFAILTPQASGKPISTNRFGETESFTPKQTGPVDLPGWARDALNRVSIPQSTVNPVVTTLSNGLTLIVQPESASNTVSVFGSVRNNHDLEEPKGKEGVNSILDKIFPYGTASLDRLGFQKALDDIGAEESAGTEFSVRVLTDRFDRGVELLADNELNPALPEKAFKIIQRQVAATVAGRIKSPDYLTDRALKAALFPVGDPTLRETTPTTVSSLTINDLRHYYGYVVRPDLTTIVVIGQVTPDRARTVIEKYFGGWKAQGPKPETLLPAVPQNKPSAANVPDASRVQDKVMLVETLGLNRFNPDYYSLELGNHVLGGAFYATRLYRDLREKTGLVYYVSSSFDVGKTRALYEVEYACDPQNVSRAMAVVVRELKEMQTTPVTAEELQQARALLVRHIPLSESSLNAIARGLIYRATHDLPLDEPIRAAKRYMELSADQVQAAFTKWVRPGDLVQVVEGPPPK